MPASSTQAFPHLHHHDVCEHVRDGVLPFCGRDRDRGRNVHVRHNICDHHICLHVCCHGYDPQCISRKCCVYYNSNVKNTR